jgi:CheY-like chemotaxis protein
MDDVTRERAFDPFFTTKGIGKSGLGLAIVFAVVKECGGHVTVSSSRGAGTRVDVFLPRVVRRAMNVNTARGNGGEHVLLVDDDPSILRAMTRTLTALGYEVDAAEGPLRALERARDPRVPIDLVIADVAMPDMNGVAMMNEVRRARPGLRALFVSGYSDRSAMHESLAADDRLLAKPFTRAALGAAVRASLDVNATK